jgi:sulfur-oxidizing protein SoxY
MAPRTHHISRRQAVAGVAATGAGLVIGVATSSDGAFAANDYAEQIRKFTGGRQPVEGLLRLELPELAENGNTVPISVTVDASLRADVHVEEILVVAPANPNSRVVRFRFSPMSVPEAASRIRLAETQNVIAVAKLSDGTFFSTSRQIKVTIGGCGG